MSTTPRQVHLAAHFPGVNNTTVWSDPAAGSHIEFSSFAATTKTGRSRSPFIQGQRASMAARICSNCHATSRERFSPAFDTTVKCGLVTWTQASAAPAGRADTRKIRTTTTASAGRRTVTEVTSTVKTPVGLDSYDRLTPSLDGASSAGA